MSIRLNVIIVTLLGASALAFWLLFGVFAIDGIKPPANLDQLVQRADAAGETYQIPNQVILGSCQEADTVSGDTIDQIERVTGEDAVSCDFKTDAWHEDALVALAAIVLLIIAIGIIYGIWAQPDNAPWALVAVALVIGIVIGAHFGHDIWEFISGNPIDESARFWRALGSYVVIVVASILVYVEDEELDD